MKLILNTLGCPGWSFDRVISEAAALGFSGIEIRGLGGILDTNEIPELSEAGAYYFKSALEKYRLRAICLGTSASFHDINTYNRSLNEAKNAVIRAYSCNISAIRVFGNNIPAGSSERAIADQVCDAIKELCRFSNSLKCSSYPETENPVKILLEAHGDFNNSAILGYVCDKIKDSAFGIIWDIAHTDRAFNAGHGSYTEFYGKLKAYIHHLHIKDHIKTPDGYSLCSIGKGTIPIKEIIQMLIDDNYKGCLSYELEKRWHPELPEPENEFRSFINYMSNLLYI